MPERLPRGPRAASRLPRHASVLTGALALLCLAPAPAQPPDRVVPAVASTRGLSGSHWRTMLQLHNPSSAPCRVRLVLRPAGSPPSEADPSADVELTPGQTRTFVDLLPELFQIDDGSGSLEMRALDGALPVPSVRVYSDGPSGGTVGLSVPALAPSAALPAGSEAVLLVPDGFDLRVNVGGRAAGEGPASLSFTVRGEDGAPRGTGQRTVPAGTLVQLPASEFAGTPVGPGDAIRVRVESGSVLLYATPIDDVTNDASFQLAEAAPGACDGLKSDFTPPTGRVGDAMGGPGVMRLMTATSPDGLVFTRTGQVVTDQGDVPDLAVDSRGRVYLYYVGWTVGTERNKPVVAISCDKGRSWVYKKVVLAGFEGMTDPVDPDVQVLPDGTFRIYLTSAPPGAGMEGARTYRAEGTDGIRFAVKGVAFQPPSGVALDPSTVRVGSTWHLFTGGQPGSNRHATSPDGEAFTFLREEVFTRDGRPQMMANGVPVGSGARFYTFDATPPPGGTTTIGSVSTADGTTWTADPGTRLTMDASSGKEGNGVKDPAVATLPDGTSLMVYATRIP